MYNCKLLVAFERTVLREQVGKKHTLEKILQLMALMPPLSPLQPPEVCKLSLPPTHTETHTLLLHAAAKCSQMNLK